MLIELTKGEILNNGIDDNGNGFIDESMDMIGYAYADGMVNLNFKFVLIIMVMVQLTKKLIRE